MHYHRVLDYKYTVEILIYLRKMTNNHHYENLSSMFPTHSKNMAHQKNKLVHSLNNNSMFSYRNFVLSL